MSQNWASKGWGGMVIPRIGMEVIVDFLEGDPDEPIVTGCVYHAQNMPAYKLPQYKTRSTFKTDTHQGQGFNELRFEDKKGREEVFVHAQRDLNTVIENDETRLIKEDRITRVGGNDRIQTEGHSVFFVKKSQNVKIGGDYYMSVGGPLVFSQVNQSYNNADRTPLFLKYNPFYRFRESSTSEGNYTLNIKGSKTEIICSSCRFESIHDYEVGSGQNIMQYARQSIKIHSEMSSYYSSNSKINIIAKDEIRLRCGSSVIIIDNNIIKINGKKVNIN